MPPPTVALPSNPSNLKNLDPGTYYWRVRAYGEDNDEIGDWSAIRRFGFIPAASVTLTAPPDGASVTEMPTLEWLSATGAGYYQVEISDNELFSGAEEDARRTVNTVYVPDDQGAWWVETSKPSNLKNLDPGTYYWRVRTFTGDDVELWGSSEIRSFVISAP